MLKWTPSAYFSLKFEECYISAEKKDDKHATQIVWSHTMRFFNLILIMSCHSIIKLNSRKLTKINFFQPLAIGFTKVSIRLQFLLQEFISSLKNLWKTAKPPQTKSTNPKHKGSRLSLQSSNINFITSNFLSHPICKLNFKGDSQVIKKHSKWKSCRDWLEIYLVSEWNSQSDYSHWKTQAHSNWSISMNGCAQKH